MSATTARDALRAIRELAPDVVVMDLNMPGVGGVEATRQIAMIAPLTRVLVLTISDQDADVLEAILAGACGYLLKDSSIDDLIAGINAAAIGESLISPAIAAKVLQHVRATGHAAGEAEPIRSELSEREIEVLKLIANGKDNAHIAGELHISPKTVKNHISNILMKLQIENRIQAAVYAVRGPGSSRTGAKRAACAPRSSASAERGASDRLVAVQPLGHRRELMGFRARVADVELARHSLSRRSSRRRSPSSVRACA